MKAVAPILALLILLPAQPAPQQLESPLGDLGTLSYDTRVMVPNVARIASLLELYYEEHPHIPRPVELRIDVLIYRDYEEQLAKHEAGPNWRLWLNAYRVSIDSLTSRAFVDGNRIREGKVRIYAWQLSDDSLVHEMSHYACWMFAPSLRSGLHRGTASDCTNGQTYDFLHSAAYRNWLREMPWLA